MNRVFSSIVLALCISTTAIAQNGGTAAQSQDPNEIIVLSSYTDGNYNVERLLVMESGDNNNEFVVRYKINLTRLISSYDNNSQEIAGLHNFIESIESDSLKKITSVKVVGYASPDGAAALNKRLADERAADFSKFIDLESDLADFPRSVSGKPYSWAEAKAAIQSSATPNKSEVLSIIDSNLSQAAIEAKLKGMPAAWDYIKTNILPPMRSVEIHINYNSWKVVENRTLIEMVSPEIVPTTSTRGEAKRGERRGEKRGSEECSLEDLNINCMLIEMPGQEIDFECEKVTEKYKSKRGKSKFKERVR